MRAGASLLRDVPRCRPADARVLWAQGDLIVLRLQRHIYAALSVEEGLLATWDLNMVPRPEEAEDETVFAACVDGPEPLLIWREDSTGSLCLTAADHTHAVYSTEYGPVAGVWFLCSQAHERKRHSVRVLHANGTLVGLYVSYKAEEGEPSVIAVKPKKQGIVSLFGTAAPVSPKAAGGRLASWLQAEPPVVCACNPGEIGWCLVATQDDIKAHQTRLVRYCHNTGRIRAHAVLDGHYTTLCVLDDQWVSARDVHGRWRYWRYARGHETLDDSAPVWVPEARETEGHFVAVKQSGVHAIQEGPAILGRLQPGAQGVFRATYTRLE